MRLREIMTTPVETVGPEDGASAAWSLMERHGIHHLVVAHGPRLVGVVSDRDLGGRSGAGVRRGRTVKELMTPKVVSATPTTTLRQAANLMRGHTIGSLPVIENDQVVGIVTATDVLDELGRGASRPEFKAPRRKLRLPPSKWPLGGEPIVRSRPCGKKKTGRARSRKPTSKSRAPFVRNLPKASKRTLGRAAAPLVPASLRVSGVDLQEEDRRYIRRKLGARLGKFAGSIERVSVRLEDVNGPRGGVDQVCRIKVVLSGLPSVVFEARDPSLDAAVDVALAGTERAVRRRVQRRREREA